MIQIHNAPFPQGTSTLTSRGKFVIYLEFGSSAFRDLRVGAASMEEGATYRPLLPSGESEDVFPGGDPLDDDAWRTGPPPQAGSSAAAPLVRAWARAAARAASSFADAVRSLALAEQLHALTVALLSILILVLLARGGGGRGAATPAGDVPSLPPSHHSLSPPGPPPATARASSAAWSSALIAVGYSQHCSFVCLWAQPESGRLLLAVPSSAFGRLVLANAEVSRADGASFLLRQPLGDSFFVLSKSSDGASVSVSVPPLALVRLGATSTLTDAAEGFGLWVAPAATLSRFDGGGAVGRLPMAEDGALVVDATEFLAARFGLALDGGGEDANDNTTPNNADGGGFFQGRGYALPAAFAAASAHPRNLVRAVFYTQFFLFVPCFNTHLPPPPPRSWSCLCPATPREAVPPALACI